MSSSKIGAIVAIGDIDANELVAERENAELGDLLALALLVTETLPVGYGKLVPIAAGALSDGEHGLCASTLTPSFMWRSCWRHSIRFRRRSTRKAKQPSSHTETKALRPTAASSVPSGNGFDDSVSGFELTEAMDGRVGDGVSMSLTSEVLSFDSSPPRSAKREGPVGAGEGALVGSSIVGAAEGTDEGGDEGSVEGCSVGEAEGIDVVGELEDGELEVG